MSGVQEAPMRIRALLLAALLVLPAAMAAGQSGALSTADQLEIQQLYARYTYAFDSNDSKILATVFVPDGDFFLGGNKMKAMGMIKGPAKARPEVHHVTTSIVFNASPEGARGSAYVTLVDLAKTPPAITGGGFYEDVIVKTPEGWRFKSRSYYPQNAPAAPAAASAAPSSK